MPEQKEWIDQELTNRVVLEVCAELDRDCAQAIVKQIKRSLRYAAKPIVLDLRKAKGLSVMGLAVLFDQANSAGILRSMEFRLADPVLQRFFINLQAIQTEFMT